MRVRVLCFGNLLAGDDGVGIHVHRRLCQLDRRWQCLQVEWVDAGLLGMSALGYFEDCAAVIVVDALKSSRSSGQPGRVRRLRLEDAPAPAAAFSAHLLDLAHMFHVLPIVFEGRVAPEVVIVGVEIEPPVAAFSMQLSAVVSGAIDRAVARVCEELEEFSRAATGERDPAVDAQSPVTVHERALETP